MADDQEREEKLRAHTKVGKTYKLQVHEREQKLDTLEQELVEQALKLPNKTHYDSPVGDESKNRLVSEGGTELIKSRGQLKMGMDHIEIGRRFDLIDFASASKLTGSKFVFLKNEAALLEMALCNWAFNLVSQKGYTPVITPDIARQSVVEACGFQPRDASS